MSRDGKFFNNHFSIQNSLKIIFLHSYFFMHGLKNSPNLKKNSPKI